MTPNPKRVPASKAKRSIKFDFDVDQTLLKNRQIFDLFEDIDDESARKTIQKLYALDTLNNDPIHLYLNSGGGSCPAGLAIINAMKTIASPVVTIITSEVCSMAGLISVAGDKRVCYPDSVWMAHDGAIWMDDYFDKVVERAKFVEKYSKLLDNHLKQYTNLTDRDLKKARNKELWLFADEMLEKGVVDEIIIND